MAKFPSRFVHGIEPSTNHVLGKGFARERAELIMLEHSEERRYSTKFVVLDGSNQIAAVHKRIDSIAHAPPEDFPPTSGRWDPLVRQG